MLASVGPALPCRAGGIVSLFFLKISAQESRLIIIMLVLYVLYLS